MDNGYYAFVGGVPVWRDEASLLQRFADLLNELHPELVAQANRQILANVGYWPTAKKGRGKLPRRAALQKSTVQRLKRRRERIESGVV